MPRMSSPGETLTGKVCVCSLGRVGVVYGQKEITFSGDNKRASVHAGFGLDGKGLWCTGTGQPVVILADSLAIYADMVAARPNSVLYAGIAVTPSKTS